MTGTRRSVSRTVCGTVCPVTNNVIKVAQADPVTALVILTNGMAIQAVLAEATRDVVRNDRQGSLRRPSDGGQRSVRAEQPAATRSSAGL